MRIVGFFGEPLVDWTELILGSVGRILPVGDFGCC